ncbi:MAG: protein-L-isoaspartate(D-aspartate) O-methyltransferase [Candidatus Methanomarinus sp.]|uniref:Protein-L-isoaspartate(D-aspartate) O-methyltransferase n=1 Tax=Candidatus Methanomarinus sp. TaxID=3386244 RepID=A0AC61SD48_9EURY|nr:MAG: Protein-L-isoaspartate O-methyltransferase [ANME-2 cluster archaeon HR1]TKY92496.1 MAG: protein-L-isoaspartate(D-aspartate) O-methyltransferase [ANME-2 cluster archaeon]
MDFKDQRTRLIRNLKSRNEEISNRVIDAMELVPRHLFVPENERINAYVDRPLSIGSGQTISAPHMVAIMCSLLDLRPGHRVLEVGCGMGYHAAVMSQLVRPGGHVYAVERIKILGESAKKNLLESGYEDVTVMIEDGSQGLPQQAPFDRISVACTAPEIPDILIEQLTQGGKMVIPVGQYMQELYLVTRSNGITKEKKGGVIFVPLIGKYGF